MPSLQKPVKGVSEMRKITLLICLLCLICLPTLAEETALDYKADFMFGTSPRFIANDDIGDIGHYGLSLYVNNPHTHNQLFGFELTDYNNQIEEDAGLTVPDHQFTMGLHHKFNQQVGLKLATHYETFLGDNPFSSYGLYPYYQGDIGGLELGREYDNEGSFSYLLGNLYRDRHQVLGAVSLEKFEEQHGQSIREDQYSRAGLALRYAVDDDWHLIGGTNYNPNLKKMSWVGGFSHSVNFRDSGINPGLMAIHRIKPNSRYTLAILTLDGKALNQSVNQVIHEAFFRGSFKRSRIIGGRYMGDMVLGSAHEQVDFGTVSIAFSALSVDVGSDSQLMQNDVTGYFSYPGTLGPLTRPYLGFTWAKFSDLIYNPMIHSLDDPEQEYFQLKMGAKIKMNGRNLRINLTLDDNGGAAIKSSWWF